MKRLRMFVITAALMTGASALATAQPFDHDGRRDGDRDRFERRYDRDDFRFRDRDDWRFGRDNRRFDRDDGRYFVARDHRFYDHDNYRAFDRDDYRFRDRDDFRLVVGERRFFNGFYWTWDGSRWCRRDRGVTLYFGF